MRKLGCIMLLIAACQVLLTGCTVYIRQKDKEVDYTNVKETQVEENIVDVDVDVVSGAAEVVEEGEGYMETDDSTKLTYLGETGVELNLYKKLSEPGKNLVYSPYSLVDAFSLLYPAADNLAKAQMEEVLGLSGDAFKFYRDYDEASKDNSGLNIANGAFYTDKDIKLNLSVIGTDNIQKVNMEGDAVPVINKFVEDATQEKIKNLVKEGQLDGAVLVLVNALYFKQPFDFEECKLYWEDGEDYKAFQDYDFPLQNIKEVNRDIDLLKLDYLTESEDEDYSLYIVADSVNSAKTQVDKFMKELTIDELNKMLDFRDYKGLKGYTDADFKMPNFEISYKESLTETLKSLGLTEPFSDVTTDFNRLGEVYVKDVLQAAYIKTDAKGTEAAAATALMTFGTTAIMQTETKHVLVDSEFAYILRDNKSGVILFMGKVATPSDVEE